MPVLMRRRLREDIHHDDPSDDQRHAGDGSGIELLPWKIQAIAAIRTMPTPDQIA